MSEDLLTEVQQAEFAVLYGTLFALSLLSEYSHAIQPILSDRNARNVHSKVLSLEKDCDAVKATIKHEFMKTMNDHQRSMFEKAIELHSETVYRMFSLDVDKQRRVWGLINQLNK